MSNRERLEAAWVRLMAVPKPKREDFAAILFGQLQHSTRGKSRAASWIVTELEAAVKKTEGGQS